MVMKNKGFIAIINIENPNCSVKTIGALYI